MRKLLLCILALLLIFSPSALAQESPLYNGDFSIMSAGQPLPAGWYYDAWNLDLSRAFVETGHGGENIIVIESLEDNDARVCQLISVKPNTAYTFCAELLTYDVAYGAGAGISVLDTFSGSEPEFMNKQWTKVTLTGVTGKNQKELVLALRVGGYGELSSGTVKFRNVTMEELDHAPDGALSFEPFEQDGGGSSKGLNISFGLTGIVFVSMAFALIGAAVYIALINRTGKASSDKGMPDMLSAFATAFVLRVLFSLIFVGHSTDITCFMGWASRMAEYGSAGFYSAEVFADYPPGYMYVLWIIGALKQLFRLNYGSAMFILLLKLPSIAAEFFTAYFIYRLARQRKLNSGASWAILMLLLFHPVFAFLSGGWGQIDSLLTMLLILTLYLFVNKARVAAGVLFGLAILIKPQALMLGPLLAIAYLLPQKNRKYWRTFFEAELALLGALAVITIFSLPFSVGQESGWLWEKYFSTISSYDYASVEAFNLAALYGGNWKPSSTVPFLLSYRTWGIIGIILSVIAAACLYIVGKKRLGKPAVYLSSAFLFAALFTLGPYMHERYIYPALPLLMIAAVYIDDRRLYLSFIWLSVTLLFNSLCAFYIIDNQTMRGEIYDSIVRSGSLTQVVGFGYLCYACYSIVFNRRVEEAGFRKEPSIEEDKEEKSNIVLSADLPQNTTLLKSEPFFTKKDRIFCCGITAVYALFALTNLGVMRAPETEYHSSTPGEQIIAEFDAEQEITAIWFFPGIAQGTILIEDGEREASYAQTYDDMFRWKSVPVELAGKRLTLTTYSGELRLREIVFFGRDNERLFVSAVTEEGYVLFDEPVTVPDSPSYLNGMYFDELYHARTAYEHLNGIDPYENSHPPLGKVFIMLGVAVFGMNPFGWRIVGTLFGIGMVPIFYAFAKRLFKKPEYALTAAILFAFDFMHFTQTRIATIDVFAVFFIILMYYYMYQYYEMSFFEDGLRATLRPLGLAGLFFGLGAASKWICIYAGLGLAVLLLFSLCKRYFEYRAAQRSDNEAIREKYGSYVELVIKTLLWCCLFYIAVPVVIYIASYTPHFMLERGYGLSDMLANQQFMFSYHSRLTDTHYFQSAWYEWPFTNRPMWYYMSGDVQPGMISSLTASGNPAVWWVCSVGTIGLIAYRLLTRAKDPFIKREPGITVMLVGVASNYLPWVLITRCTFIYHFFATVPFIILCALMLLYKLEEKHEGFKLFKWAWAVAAIVLFLLLYPGISGLEVPLSYARLLKYLPGGGLFYGA